MECNKGILAFLFTLILIVSAGFFQCGRTPLDVQKIETGTLELRVQICEALRKVSAVAMTSFDSIVIEITASDMQAMRNSSKVSAGLVIIDTCFNIPAGNKRGIKIYTVDKNGAKIHIDSIENRFVRIDQNTTTIINATLIPAAGSLYLQIANVPTSVDSLFVSFVSIDGTWVKHAKRSLKMPVSLDNIPDGTQGTVYLVAVNSSGDTIYQASSRLTFNARRSTQLDLNFEIIPGQIAMNLTLRNTGVTLMVINMADPGALNERGDLVITEIMYNAPDSSEYIEVYNPCDSTILIDTLIIDIDNSRKKITDLSIAAHTFYILGRKSYPWVDKLIDPSSFLDLSQSGNLITLRAKDSTVIDQLIFTGGSNSLEWPNGATKKAIALDSTKYEVTMNNFGSNWFTVTTHIVGTDSLFGSPHKK